MQIAQNLCEKENRPVVNIKSWPAVCQSLVRYDVGIAQWPASSGQQLLVASGLWWWRKKGRELRET